MAITGYGEINSSGLAFYDEASADASGRLSKPETPRPRTVMFYKCRNVLFEDVSFIDCPCWTFWLMKCEDVNIHRIKIFSNRRMLNVDGIDIDACRNVTVSDCIMDTEDDCISIRSMQKFYDTPTVCENITVSNCVLESDCNGIRIGCPGDTVIKNCVFSNIVIKVRGRGIVSEHPKGYLSQGNCGSADISNIIFSNITINCKRAPVHLYVEEGVKLKRLSDLSFSGFRVRSGKPLIIQGSRETIIRKVSFDNMEIETSGNDTIVCRQCKGVKFSNVELSNQLEPFDEEE
jgi:hypothetical protein